MAKIASVSCFIHGCCSDVKNAFLHIDLEDEVYMEQPHGFVAQRESSNMVCRVRQALDGLNLSP